MGIRALLRRLLTRKHRWVVRASNGMWLIYCARCGKERGHIDFEWQPYMAEWVADDTPCQKEHGS